MQSTSIPLWELLGPQSIVFRVSLQPFLRKTMVLWERPKQKAWINELIQWEHSTGHKIRISFFQSVKQKDVIGFLELATSRMPQPRWKRNEPDNKTKRGQTAHAQSWSLSLFLANFHKNPMEVYSILIFPSWAHDAWRCSYFISTQDHGEKRVSYVFARLVGWQKPLKILLSDMWTEQAQNGTLATARE